MTYHLESDSTAIYFWRDGGPCIAILPVDQDRPEAERFARLLLAAANNIRHGEVAIRPPHQKPISTASI